MAIDRNWIPVETKGMEENRKNPTGDHIGFKVTVIMLLSIFFFVSCCAGFVIIFHIENHGENMNYNYEKGMQNEESIKSINRQIETINKRLDELDGN